MNGPSLNEAPGDGNVRLRALRVIDAEGNVGEGFDIRKPVGLQMEFDVLQPGQLLMPYFHLANDEGTVMFSTIDQDTRWHTEPRMPGRYVSTAWIPGNLLSEGMVYVSAAMRTKVRKHRPFQEGDAVAFNVIDTMEGGSARGEWAGRLLGAVRPKLDWTTEYQADEQAKTG